VRGSGQIHKEIRCQSGCGGCKGPDFGCGSKRPRLQYGVENGSDEVDFTVTVKIPENYNANGTATLQVGGASHHTGCDILGYKGYIGINGGKPGFEVESGSAKNYDYYQVIFLCVTVADLLFLTGDFFCSLTFNSKSFFASNALGQISFKTG
jgi:hypothetical protein